MVSSGRRFRRIGIALTAVGASLLASCSGPAGPATTGAVPPAPAIPAPTPSAAAPATPAPDVAVVPPLGPSAAPPPDVQRLIGLKGDILREWMGDTVFVRHDGIAEIWRFASDTCFLDVFLYRERDGLRVAHLDARARTGNQRVVPQTCYGRILADHKRPAPS